MSLKLGWYPTRQLFSGRLKISWVLKPKTGLLNLRYGSRKVVDQLGELENLSELFPMRM